MKSLLLLSVLLVILCEGRNYPEHAEYGYRDPVADASQDCPLKCRCMDLGHIGLQALRYNWQSDEAWRADGPSGRNDSGLEGRDMVCTGRGLVPWPMPDGNIQGQYYNYGIGIDGRAIRAQNCPLKCRCMALGHLEQRLSDQSLQPDGYNGRLTTNSNGKDTDLGIDVVCSGLNVVPWDLPEDVVKLTLYGDSSDIIADDPHMQAKLTSLRDYSFSNGDNIRELTISGNNLEILYPYIFRNLRSLQNLAMQNNNIRHLSAAAFSGLAQLKELRLSDNMIRFLSPTLFQDLPNLQYLYLNGNKLSTIHPDLFKYSERLVYLDISRNSFRTLYDTVFDSTPKLEELLVNENTLETINPRWFKNLSHLKNLEFRGNALTKIDPSSFKSLLNLERLVLSANAITTISDEAFTDLTKLQALDISTNDINALEPNCFAGLESLDELDLSGNRLASINNHTFPATPKLRKLIMSKNSIKDIEKAALHSLGNLQELDLSYNKLREIKSKTFSGLLELKEINLEHNIISEIEDDAFIVAALNQLSKITWLSLQYNRISSLGAYSLFGLPHLKFLNMGHNKLKKINKKAFYTLSSLQNMMLHSNRISKLEDATFSNLKLLKSLNMKHNKIAEISDNFFLGLKNLEDLDLVSNAIDLISPNAFKHFSNLKRLDLENNLISNFVFSDLISAKKLEMIDLSNNMLYKVSFPNQQTHNINQLILSGNTLRTITSDVTNVLSPAGSLWLKENPWSCDCNLGWLVDYRSQYRIRLLGIRDTVCQTPSSLHGTKVTDIARDDFQCDNTTVAETLSCQNLQVRVSTRTQPDLRSGKKESRNWHVTFQDVNNANDSCNGLLVHENWVVTRFNCTRSLFMRSKNQVKVKIGRRESRRISLSLDYPNEANAEEFDLKLVRLMGRDKRKRASKEIPCLLKHAQFYQLSRAITRGVATARAFKTNNGQYRLLARTGKLQNKCGGNNDICLKFKGDALNLTFYGSPLSMRYQGLWYVAGLGVGTHMTETQRTFTPLWGAAGWIANAMHEIDTKCTFQTANGGSRTLCENLNIPGVAETQSFSFT